MCEEIINQLRISRVLIAPLGLPAMPPAGKPSGRGGMFYRIDCKHGKPVQPGFSFRGNRFMNREIRTVVWIFSF